jgi:hypothetical protein
VRKLPGLRSAAERTSLAALFELYRITTSSWRMNRSATESSKRKMAALARQVEAEQRSPWIEAETLGPWQEGAAVDCDRDD